MHVLLIPISYKSKFNHLSSPFFRDQAVALVKQGCEVGIICPLAISFKQIWKSKSLNFKNECYSDDGVKTLIYPFVSIPKSPERTRRIRLSEGKEMFKQYIQKNGLPDIVHSHVFLAAELALWVKENYGIPYVLTEHSTGFARQKYSRNFMSIASKVFENSSLNIAVSNEFAVLLKSIFNIEFKYVPNMIDTDFFKPDSKKVLNNGFTFLNVGFLDKKKNQISLIIAFSNLFKNNSKFKLDIVGDGPEMNNLKSYIDLNGLQSQVTLYGNMCRSEVKTKMLNSDCFVLSSDQETFGVVLIEAMACGVPVLSTKSGGPESIITNEKLGILTDLNHLEINMLKISKLNFDSEVLRNHIIDNFSSKVVSSLLMKMYKKILS